MLLVWPKLVQGQRVELPGERASQSLEAALWLKAPIGYARVLWGWNMGYVLAAVRTVAILLGICVALFVVALVAGAFLQSWLAGGFALALVCSIGALFGYELYRVAKSERTKSVGFVTCWGFGAVALLSLLGLALVPVEKYLWASEYLPILKAVFGIEPPFGRWGQAVAVFVFLDISFVCIVVAPIKGLLWLIRN